MPLQQLLANCLVWLIVISDNSGIVCLSEFSAIGIHFPRLWLPIILPLMFMLCFNWMLLSNAGPCQVFIGLYGLRGPLWWQLNQKDSRPRFPIKACEDSLCAFGTINMLFTSHILGKASVISYYYAAIVQYTLIFHLEICFFFWLISIYLIFANISVYNA